MSKDVRMSAFGPPIAGAPTWLRVLQAALIGIVAGLALHALFSIVVLQGSEAGQGRQAPSQCRKNAPPRDVAAPRPGGPRISGVGAYIPLALDGGTIPFIRM
jgi:hypothetical protein